MGYEHHHHHPFCDNLPDTTYNHKVLTPESRILVAGENHVKIAFLVVATVDQVKEQPRILFIEFAMADLINDQAGWAN